MAGINWGRVVLGGLLAGLVINISGFIRIYFFTPEAATARFQELGVGMAGGGAQVVAIVAGFLIGIAAVWLYASIRPRYGAGVGTAIWAGLTVWFFNSLLVGVLFANLGIFSVGLVTPVVIWRLVELCVATVAGAWPYQEGGGQAAPAG